MGVDMIDVIKLAEAAGASESAVTKAVCFRPDELSRFAEMHRALVLEEAAKECDKQAKEPECPERASYCADAIRALKPAQE